MNFKRIARVHEELIQGLETFSLERLFFSVGYKCVIGLFTDGKEAAFGPLVTCGVPIDVHHSLVLLNDKFDSGSIPHVVDVVSCIEINKFGNVDEVIRRSKLSLIKEMKREYPHAVVVTDYLVPDHLDDCFPVIRGDRYVYTLKLAAFISRERRKNEILTLLRENPDWRLYDLEMNLGFLSKRHRQALSEFGKTSHHRYFVRI